MLYDPQLTVYFIYEFRTIFFTNNNTIPVEILYARLILTLNCGG